MARSFRTPNGCSLRPGTLIATHRRTPRSTFTNTVESASPSTSPATNKSGLAVLIASSRIGRTSASEPSFARHTSRPELQYPIAYARGSEEFAVLLRYLEQEEHLAVRKDKSTSFDYELVPKGWRR